MLSSDPYPSDSFALRAALHKLSLQRRRINCLDHYIAERGLDHIRTSLERERKRGYHACDRKTLVLARLFPSDGVSDDPEACQNSRSNLRNSCPQWYLKNDLLDSLPLEQRYSEMAVVSR